MREPGSVTRAGGWSLGESTHLINEARLLEDGVPPAECKAFLCEQGGTLTLPVLVDHVGSRGTRYAVGELRPLSGTPRPEQLALIPLAEAPEPQGSGKKRRRA